MEATTSSEAAAYTTALRRFYDVADRHKRAIEEPVRSEGGAVVDWTSRSAASNYPSQSACVDATLRWLQKLSSSVAILTQLRRPLVVRKICSTHLGTNEDTTTNKFIVLQECLDLSRLGLAYLWNYPLSVPWPDKAQRQPKGTTRSTGAHPFRFCVVSSINAQFNDTAAGVKKNQLRKAKPNTKV